MLVEKPLGDERRGVPRAARPGGRGRGLVVQVGNNRRFDPGHRVRPPVHPGGDRASGSRSRPGTTTRSYRYTMTDNLQPIPIAQRAGPRARGRSQGRPAAVLPADPRQPPGRHGAVPRRADRRRSGPDCSSGSARSAGSSTVDFADGALGHLDLHDPGPRRLPGRVPDLRRARQRLGRTSPPLVPQVERGRVLLDRGTASSAAPSARTPTPTSARSRASPTTILDGAPQTRGDARRRPGGRAGDGGRSRARSRRASHVRLADATGVV